MLNRDELFARCLNDTDFVRQMLGVFRESAPTTLDRLKKAINDGVAADTKRHAHTLKGSAANLALEPLRILAADAERAAGASDMETVASLAPKIESALQASLTEIARYEQDLSKA